MTEEIIVWYYLEFFIYLTSDSDLIIPFYVIRPENFQLL